MQEFIREDSFKHLRQFLIMCLSSNEVGAILLFDNEFGGGAHQVRSERIAQIVNSGNAVFLVSYKSNKEKIATLRFNFKSYNFSFSIKELSDLVPLFAILKIEEIIVNSFVSFSGVGDWLALTTQIRAAADCKLTFLLHDFFSICPSYTLINDSSEYCGVPSDQATCRRCLNRNTGDFKRFESHADIVTWRAQWGKFLRCCTKLYALATRLPKFCVGRTLELICQVSSCALMTFPVASNGFISNRGGVPSKG